MGLCERSNTVCVTWVWEEGELGFGFTCKVLEHPIPLPLCGMNPRLGCVWGSALGICALLCPGGGFHQSQLQVKELDCPAWNPQPWQGSAQLIPSNYQQLLWKRCASAYSAFPLLFIAGFVSEAKLIMFMSCVLKGLFAAGIVRY